MLTANFPTLCIFGNELQSEESAAQVLNSGKPEYSAFKIVTDISPAMVKDSSESNEDVFSKSTKYPLLVLTFLALSNLITEPVVPGRVKAALNFQANLRTHLSFSILRV